MISAERQIVVVHPGCLTVKLRGRMTTPAGRRGRTIFPSARGAKQEAFHGPLQRLLGVTGYIPDAACAPVPPPQDQQRE
jgi:hypothetical protein